MWRCECNGSPASEAILFGEDGYIYYSGYLQPDFVAIDGNGEIKKEIDILSDQYYWPYKMEYTDDGEIAIYFEGSETGSGGVVNVIPDTYEYYVPEEDEV